MKAAQGEVEFDTDELLHNDNAIDRLRKEIEELKYQIDREKREGDRLKQILAGGGGDQAEALAKMRKDLDNAIAWIDSMKGDLKFIPTYIASNYN